MARTDTAPPDTSPTDTRQPVQAVEHRTIDHVPDSERYGKVWHLGPMWFMANASLTIFATGFIGLAAGANLFWTLVAIVVGAAFGTFFMAFHSAQGPQLGMPQIVQSRAQFGYLGTVVVTVGVLVMYVGYNVFNNQLAAQAVSSLGVRSDAASYGIVTVVATALAIFGYRWIHRVQQLLTYVFLVVFGVFTIGALLFLDLPAGALKPGSFALTPFLAQLVVAAASQLGWAPYVADYSRYLPAGVGIRATFWWTYLGSLVGAIWLMGFGAYVQATATESKTDVIEVVRDAADRVIPDFGAVVLGLSVPVLIAIIAINMYGAGLTVLTIANSVTRFQPRFTHRVAATLVIAAVALVGALASSADFLANFYNLIVVMLYLLIPWTAVNLVDYYVVRRGHYVISEIFNPNGIYGRWSWRGLTAYLVGFAAMLPFMAIGTWYQGPVAKALNGADISMFVGLAVSALLYTVFCRSLDLERERAVADRLSRQDAETQVVKPS